jgi:dTDP-L-rhamnose 4-epimerase
MSQTILITGGAGFIGSSLALALVNNGEKVRIIDNFNPQVHSNKKLSQNLQDNVELIIADVQDRDALKCALDGVSKIVHLAAETGTGQSMYEIDRYFKVNVQGTALLLDLLQNDRCGRFVKSIVLASSRAVYGEGAYKCHLHGIQFPAERAAGKMKQGFFDPFCGHCDGRLILLPTMETSPFNPMSFYGLTKQVQEQAVLLFAKTRGINGFALRYQNVYGPGQSLKNPYTGILAVFSNLARQNLDIDVYEDGLESRDFIYLDDVVDATVKSINFTESFVGPLNVGSGVGIDVLHVAQQIMFYFGSKSNIKVTGAYRMGDIRHNIADISQIAHLLGFSPKVKFKDGLEKFLDWASEYEAMDSSGYLKSVSELSSRGLIRNS